MAKATMTIGFDEKTIRTLKNATAALSEGGKLDSVYHNGLIQKGEE